MCAIPKHVCIVPMSPVCIYICSFHRFGCVCVCQQLSSHLGA